MTQPDEIPTFDQLLERVAGTTEITPSLIDEPHTDLGNSRRLVAAHGHDLRYAPQYGAWLTWDGHRWAEDLTGETQRRAKSVVDAMVTALATIEDSDARKAMFKHWLRSQSASRIGAMIDLARTEPDMPVTVAQLDADPWALNTRTGVIDLRTGDLTPSARHALVTKLAPVHLDPTATCPTWLEFLHWAMQGDAELVEFLQRAVGYSLTGLVTEQCLFFLHGHGENGKSTFINVLSALLGDYAVAAEPDLLIASPHERHTTGLTDLVGRRLAIVQETDEGRRLAEATVKQLTGGDTIRARRMRQDNFEFRPTWKLWMAANHRPVVRGTDHAIWRRIRLIPFTATLAPGQRDDHLGAKLIAELPGILNWALEGCAAWQRNGLQPPAAIVAATGEYRQEQDHVGRFIEDLCDLDADVCVSAKDLRQAYETWCAENGERPWSARAMAPQLRERGCERVKAGRLNAYTWVGITLASDRNEVTPQMRIQMMSEGKGPRPMAGPTSADLSDHSQRSALANDLPGETENRGPFGPLPCSPYAHARDGTHAEHGPKGPRSLPLDPDEMF